MSTFVAVYGTPEPLAITGSTRVCRIPAIDPYRGPIHGRGDLAPVVARGPAALRRALAEAASTGEQVRVFDPATCCWWFVT